jgi:hypothetical protein
MESKFFGKGRQKFTGMRERKHIDSLETVKPLNVKLRLPPWLAQTVKTQLAVR